MLTAVQLALCLELMLTFPIVFFPATQIVENHLLANTMELVEGSFILCVLVFLCFVRCLLPLYQSPSPSTDPIVFVSQTQRNPGDSVSLCLGVCSRGAHFPNLHVNHWRCDRLGAGVHSPTRFSSDSLP